ncbi:MAG: type II toxin-antitoxin system Phd/YefM family antitoxin [Candidatus Omnitrophica bacterium]|nr:type II toxin-antitoxin system Phd/YefM family antitoxin [Candidatus Omnitrophota bacterium]
MTTLTATDARKGFFDMIKGATKKHRIYHIHHKNGDVVLMSEEEFDGLRETLELLSIPGFRKSIAESVKQMKKGETVSLDEVFGNTK